MTIVLSWRILRKTLRKEWFSLRVIPSMFESGSALGGHGIFHAAIELTSGYPLEALRVPHAKPYGVVEL